MKFIVAGYGYVGKAVVNALEIHHECLVHDPRLGHIVIPEDHQDADGLIVCVATPMGEKGMCDSSAVIHTCKDYPDMKTLIKSTTDPSVLKTLANGNRAFSPEFLRGTTGSDPIDDFMRQKFMIVGGAHGRFWFELFRDAIPSLTEVRYMSLEQAGILKYMENTFLATKVSFFNEMYRIYKAATGTEEGFDQVVEALALDERIGASHTQVPGPDGEFGWGGHCLPKDVAAFKYYAQTVGYDSDFLYHLQWLNKTHRGGR